ncbi:protein YcgL [Halomonas elongata]|uniref:Protein YcgL n=1 Tax=Halomonas elongata TaxID=2746 RepID=A0A1B8P4D2_HALEL|nr:protein YcgL [Halomonas elongata]
MTYFKGKLLCEVFKSPRKDEMYLFVDKTRGLAEVPEALLERFGEPGSTMSLLLTPRSGWPVPRGPTSWRPSRRRAITCSCRRPRMSTCWISIVRRRKRSTEAGRGKR